MKKTKEVAGLGMQDSELLDRIPEYDNVLALMNRIFEQQEALVKLESRETLHGYGFSETHCIDLVGNLENPNTTMIAEQLEMTRGAISKVMKRLIEKGLVESYRLEGNRKEIYFRLTQNGWEIYEAHRERHQTWLKRDYEFLNSLEPELFQTAVEFVTRYDAFLHDKIKMMKNG